MYKKIFPVKTIELDTVNSEPHQIRQSWQFVFGKTHKIAQTVNNTEYFNTKLPINVTNLVKHYIVTNCPSLNFGWLIPAYLILEIPQSITYEKTYIKAIPLDKYYDKDHYTYLITD